MNGQLQQVLIILFMKGQVQGSSPKHLIKRTHNRNPTFHSYQLFDLLHLTPNAEKTQQLSDYTTNRNKPAFSFNGLLVGELPMKSSIPHLPNIFDLGGQGKPERKEKQMQHAFNIRSKSTGRMQLDSLYKAEDEFSRSKLRNPLHYISANPFQNPERHQSPSILQSPAHSRNQLNFKNSKSIIQKQNVNYNIITNLAQM